MKNITKEILSHSQGTRKTLDQGMTWPNHPGPCSGCHDSCGVCFPMFSCGQQLRPRDGGSIDVCKIARCGSRDVLRKACKLQKLLSLSHQLPLATTERAAGGGRSLPEDHVTNSTGTLHRDKYKVSAVLLLIPGELARLPSGGVTG